MGTTVMVKLPKEFEFEEYSVKLRKGIRSKCIKKPGVNGKLLYLYEDPSIDLYCYGRTFEEMDHNVKRALVRLICSANRTAPTERSSQETLLLSNVIYCKKNIVNHKHILEIAFRNDYEEDIEKAIEASGEFDVSMITISKNIERMNDIEFDYLLSRLETKARNKQFTGAYITLPIVDFPDVTYENTKKVLSTLEKFYHNVCIGYDDPMYKHQYKSLYDVDFDRLVDKIEIAHGLNQRERKKMLDILGR